ncbi:hypothetical protein BSG8_36780 [Bacillus subtilis subsp. natto]|nr:hypothetical protein BSG8_36780 [Bacillus subtilis subsp. natto]
MAAVGYIPVVGWAGRAFKGGKAIYKTGKAAIAAEHALDAYKTGKSLDILKMTEMGAYGLVASNGFSEAVRNGCIRPCSVKRILRSRHRPGYVRKQSV